MTYELWTLVAVGFYLMILGYIPGVAKIIDNDVIGQRNFNRDNLKPLVGVGARAQRAIDNLYESLPVYSVLVVAIHLTDAYNEMTHLGATLFLVARTLHPLFYVLGRPFLRSASYMVATLGILLLVFQL